MGMEKTVWEDREEIAKVTHQHYRVIPREKHPPRCQWCWHLDFERARLGMSPLGNDPGSKFVTTP